jgi:hypothetical protein
MENNNKKIFLLGGAILIILGLFLSLLFLNQNKSLNKSAYGAGTLTLVSSSASPGVNDEVFVEVRLTTTEKAPSFDVTLGYDPAKIEVVSFGTKGFEKGPLYGVADTFNNNATTGKVTFGSSYLDVGSTNFPTGTNIVLGKIKIKGKVAGEATISFDPATRIIGYNPGNADTYITIGTKNPLSITFGQGGTTIAPTQAPTKFKINFSVKFQGVTEKRPDQKVKVIVKKGAEEESFTNVNVVANDSGVYSGSVNVTKFDPGSGFLVYIKGPRHLAKKFCVNNQVGRCNPEQSFTFTSGDNNLSLIGTTTTSTYLEGGDLPNPNDGFKQDGVANSIDFGLLNQVVHERLHSTAVNDILVGDIDLDGEVTATDLLRLRQTLESKYEEDY